MHSFRQTSEKEWSVFFYNPGICHTVSKHDSPTFAAQVVSFLNGGMPSFQEDDGEHEEDCPTLEDLAVEKFREVWTLCAECGNCDALHSQEYLRVLRIFLNQFESPAVCGFILACVNKPPTPN